MTPKRLSTRELLDRLEQDDPGLLERARRSQLQRGLIGAQLWEARMAQGFTQRELASASGVRQSDISELECGGGNPTRATLEKLGVALDIDFVVGRSSAA
jgi:DNA-binding XRE family transcriptional regulator